MLDTDLENTSLQIMSDYLGVGDTSPRKNSLVIKGNQRPCQNLQEGVRIAAHATGDKTSLSDA